MLIRGKGVNIGAVPICQNQSQNYGCINSISQNNNQTNLYQRERSHLLTNKMSLTGSGEGLASNVSFGRSISYYTALMDAEHSKGCIESSKAVLKYLSEKIMPKRRVPKDGVWGVVGSKLNNMIAGGEINPEKLTDYKIRKVHIEVPYEGKNYSHLERVLRRTFTQDNGQIKYYQDLYPNGKLETTIVKRNPTGELISDDSWIEMAG